MIPQTLGQALTALVLGPPVIVFFWFCRSNRLVNRIIDSFVQNGKATDLDRDTIARQLRAVTVFGMGLGVFVVGLGLADLISVLSD